MNPEINPGVPASSYTSTLRDEERFESSICWGAILAGAFTAVAIQLLLTLLGSGIGLGLFDPMKDADPLKNFSVGAAVIWSVCALISLWIGGMVGGFFAKKVNSKSGPMHGVVVWCVIMIVSFALVSMGLGVTAGGAVKVVGAGLGMGGGAVAAAAGEAGKEGLQRGRDQLSSFISEATSSSNSTPANAIRSQREISFGVAKLFSPENENNFAENRNSLITALSQNGMSQGEATKMVDDWINSYRNLKNELKSLRDTAERKARETADAASRNLAWASAVTFVAFLLGLTLTCMGAACGARCANRATSCCVTNASYPRDSKTV